MATNYQNSLITQRDLTDLGTTGVINTVLNGTNWSGLEVKPNSFVLANAFGSVQNTGNTNFDIYGMMGIKPKYTAIADLETPDVGDSDSIEMHTIFGTGVDLEFRAGEMLIVNGYSHATAPTKASALLLITAIDTSTHVATVTCLRTSTGSAVIFLAAAAGGSTVASRSENDTWGGSAPDSFSVEPNKIRQYMGLMRVPYGYKDTTISQQNDFGDLAGNTEREAENLLHHNLENMFMLSEAPLKENATDTIYGTSIVGTGGDRSYAGGLPWLLGCSNLSLSETKYHNVNIGTTATVAGLIDACDTTEGKSVINGLYDWAMKFNTGGDVLMAFTSGDMMSLIRKSAAYFGTTFFDGQIALPNLTIFYKEIKLGNISIRLINSDVLSGQNAPVIYDGTNYGYRNYFLFAINPSFWGLSYHMSKKDGLMVPANFEIPAVRRIRQEEFEYTAACAPALWNQHRHGVFFISTSAPS